MPEPVVVTAMREFKAGLLQREAGQMREMAGRWLGVERALEAQVDALAYDFAQRRENGKAITPGALYRMTRYKSLLAQTKEQFAEYAGWAEGRVREGQEREGRVSLTEAAQAIQLSYEGRVGPQFDRLPVEAIESMVGVAGDGRPLGDLLRERIAPGYSGDQRASVWAQLTQALVDSTALGRNPRDTARKMRDSLAGGLTKALTIARSEQMRVYRQAGLDQYKASGVVQGQKRLAAHDSRVCAACIADEGTLYSLEATISDHPQGRCTAVPLVDGMPEIHWLSGEAWFRTQPEGVQRSILGPGKFDAWRDGQFEFGALATPTFDETWGAGLRPTSLADLLAGRGGETGAARLSPPEPEPEPDRGGRPGRVIPAQERQAAAELAEAREAYEAMLAAGDEFGAEGVKGYMDALDQSLQQEQRLNTELWNVLGVSPDEATVEDWKVVAQAAEREGYELYKKYSREGIRVHVAERRGAQDSHYQNVGKEVVLVRQGRFSRREAQRMEGELWASAKKEMEREAGVLLRQMGYSARDIGRANYEQRMRLIEELGRKRVARTKAGRISKIDQVPAESRERATSALDYDAAAVCAGVQGDPLNLPTLDAWGKMELADIIRTTRIGE